MQILFIGGSGNISTDCVRELIRRGNRISAVTRGERELPPGCESIIADCYNESALRFGISGKQFDAVIDFLSFKPEDILRTLDCISDCSGHYIFISSATVYEKPLRSLPITEDTPLGNPWSEYARAKQACEELLASEATKRGIPFTIVRPSHTYGEQWIPNLISSAGFTFGARLLAGKPVIVPDDGQSLWTLTTSRDFAVGLAGLITNPAAFGQSYHITSDQALTWNQITLEAAMALKAENPVIVPIPSEFICEADPELTDRIKGDKSHHTIFDNARIKAAVPDFECLTTLREGMQISARWFMADSSRQVVDPVIEQRYERIIAAWQAC